MRRKHDIFIAKHFTVISIKTSQALTRILFHSQHDSFKDSFKGTHAPTTFDLASYQEEKIIYVHHKSTYRLLQKVESIDKSSRVR